MNERAPKITIRRAQVLLSVAMQLNVFHRAKFSSTLGDVGVAPSTLNTHFKNLEKLGLIKINGTSDNADIVLTDAGNAKSNELMLKLGFSYSDPYKSVYDKLNASIESRLFNKSKNRKSSTILSFLDENYIQISTSLSGFSSGFNEIILNNPSEPVLTSMLLYSDLDGRFEIIRKENQEVYNKLSRSTLNLTTRNGRLASIVIPVIMRGSTAKNELTVALGNSWSWLGTVDSSSLARYWKQAEYLGLVQIHGNNITSLRPTTTDMLSWLSDKTAQTFLKAPGIIPRSSLVVYRESFKFPTKEDLLKPRLTDLLEWLPEISAKMGSGEYEKIINETLNIMVNQTQLISIFEDRYVPYTILRKINELPDEKELLQNILKPNNKENPIYKILLSVIAQPGITEDFLLDKINQNHPTQKQLTKINFDNIINQLVNKGLIIIAKSSPQYSCKLYSFIHFTYFSSQNRALDDEKANLNVTIRSMKPYYINLVTDLFNFDERRILYNLFNKLTQNNYLSIDETEHEYKAPFSRKLIAFCETLKPFLTPEPDRSGYKLEKEKNNQINKILIDSIQFSLYHQVEAYPLYDYAISTFLEKDLHLDKNFKEDIKSITDSFIKLSMRR